MLDSVNIPFVALNIIISCLAIYYAMCSTTSFTIMRKLVVNIVTAMILLNIIFTTLHLGIFYICFEMLIVPLFFLIGAGTTTRRIKATMLFLMYTIAFSYVMLFGLIYIWVWFGTLHYPRVLVILYSLTGDTTPVYLIWWTLVIAFLAKIPVIPVHIWLPEAHAEATAVGSVLLAALVLKVGSYGIIRFLLPLVLIMDSDWTFVFLTIFCMLSAAYATVMTFVQVDFKRIIAYSSVAHLSFAAVGLFNCTKQGLLGSYYYNIGHGFVSAALFFLAGMLYKRHGSRLLKYYTGLALLPYLSGFLLFFSFANIGFPGTVNFLAEFLIIASLVFVHAEPLLILVGITFFGSLVFSLWTYLRVASGAISQHILYLHTDLEPYERIILGILVIFTLALGIFPKLFFFNFFHIR